MKPPARVLVVDDQEDIRRIVGACLQRLGCEAVFAHEGAEAVEKFRQDAFAAVLMDIQMPGMDGYAATRAIRLWEQERGRCRTPVIALTAYAEDEEKARIQQAGCDTHVTKPIRTQRLLEALAPYLGRSGERSEPAPLEVLVDPELAELIPDYLEKRRMEVSRLLAALTERDFELIQTLGHRMRGVAASYGFEGLSEIGTRMEKSAQGQDEGALRLQIEELRDYLARVRYRPR